MHFALYNVLKKFFSVFVEPGIMNVIHFLCCIIYKIKTSSGYPALYLHKTINVSQYQNKKNRLGWVR